MCIVGTGLYNDTCCVGMLWVACALLRAILALLVQPLYHLINNEPRNISLGSANDISPKQCMFTYMHVCVCVCLVCIYSMHVLNPTEKHKTHTQACMTADTHTHAHTHAHTCTHKHAHACKHARTHTQWHPHTHNGQVPISYTQCAGSDSHNMVSCRSEEGDSPDKVGSGLGAHHIVGT